LYTKKRVQQIFVWKRSFLAKCFPNTNLLYPLLNLKKNCFCYLLFVLFIFLLACKQWQFRTSAATQSVTWNLCPLWMWIFLWNAFRRWIANSSTGTLSVLDILIFLNFTVIDAYLQISQCFSRAYSKKWELGISNSTNRKKKLLINIKDNVQYKLVACLLNNCF
jgi:hypothetical protein